MMVLCNWGKFGKEVRGLAIGPGSRVLDDSIPLRRGFNARGEDSRAPTESPFHSVTAG